MYNGMSSAHFFLLRARKDYFVFVCVFGEYTHRRCCTFRSKILNDVPDNVIADTEEICLSLLLIDEYYTRC